MAFAATKTADGVSGNMRVSYGTFTGGAPTTAEVKTGLSQIVNFELTGASAITTSGGTATVTSASTAGFWKAEGY